VSFTSFNKIPLLSREEIARRIHAVSLKRDLDALATVIALMTVSTEVGANDENGNRQWWCPANPTNEPTSVNFAHDSTSNDGRSVGYFQQQTPWWGTVQDEMTLESAANNFLDRLDDNYHIAANSAFIAGQFAQKVQGSEFPDRYAEKWDEAWAVFNRAVEPTPLEPLVDPGKPDFKEVNLIGTRKISNNSQSRNGTKPDLALGHTTEGSGGLDLVTYMEGAQVSYHYLIDNDLDGNTVYDLVDTDRASWSVGNYNNRTINYVIGRSTVEWTRDEWLTKARKAIRIMAYLMVQDCKKYGIDPVVIPPDYTNPKDVKYYKAPPGISDHRYVTEYLGWGTHTDCGQNFPFDILKSDVEYFVNGGAEQPSKDGPLMALSDEQQQQLFDNAKKAAENTQWIRDQLDVGFDVWGEDGDLGRNSKGQRLTFRAGLARALRMLKKIMDYEGLSE